MSYFWENGKEVRGRFCCGCEAIVFSSGDVEVKEIVCYSILLVR